MARAEISCPLQRVRITGRSFDRYRPYASEAQYEQIMERARGLRGLRVIEINSTPRGGGVATMLQGVIPALDGLGLDVRWYSMGDDRPFFEVTKMLSFLLQGGRGDLTSAQLDRYCRTSEKLAAQVDKLSPDVLLIHDPQPAAIPGYLRRPPSCGLLWRGHIDLSQPNPGALAFFEPLLLRYDLIVLEVEAYKLPGIPDSRQRFVPDAIDPLSRKNRLISRRAALKAMARVGMNPRAPVICQVARFDPWKNPAGVVEAYRIARRQVPDLQLAMLGTFVAQDDPTAERVYQDVTRVVGDDRNVHLFTNSRVIDQPEVDAFQTGSDAVLLFSCREGFGTAATEAMWKCNAVIGGDVPGLRAQIDDGVDGFLVSPDDVDGCADRIVRLVRERDLAHAMGRRAHERVRRHFLLPRLIDDRLGLFEQVASSPKARAA